MGEYLISCPDFIDKALDKVYSGLDKAAFAFHDFLRRVPNKIHKPVCYILSVPIPGYYKGDRAMKQEDLNRAFQIAETELERCDNRLPLGFLRWKETKAFTDGKGTYAIFWEDFDTPEKLVRLDLIGLHENQNEKVSKLLRKLDLPFFITRDLLPVS